LKLQEMEEELRLELEAALSQNLKMKLMQGDVKHSDSSGDALKNAGKDVKDTSNGKEHKDEGSSKQDSKINIEEN